MNLLPALVEKSTNDATFYGQAVSQWQAAIPWLTIALIVWKIVDIVRFLAACCSCCSRERTIDKDNVDDDVISLPAEVYKTPAGKCVHITRDCQTIKHVDKSDVSSISVCRTCARKHAKAQTQERKVD